MSAYKDKTQGTWYVSFRYIDWTGKKTQKLKRGFKTKKEALNYEKEKAEILAIENEDKRQEELDKLNATQDEWKLRAMGTTIGCHTIVKKGTEGNSIKTYDLT